MGLPGQNYMINKDDISNILNLLAKQQLMSENISKLVESMVNEIGKFREQSERLAIVTNKMDGIEKIVSLCDARRSSCAQRISEQFTQFDNKREQNKDRIAHLEHEMGSALPKLRNELENRIREHEKCVFQEFSSIRESIGFMAGKYGAVTAGAVSVVMLVLKWIFDHQK